MRNLFFMVFCMVALLLPQSLWAQSALVSNGKLTITTNAGGQVSTYLGTLTEEATPKLSEVKACTTLELIGYFTSEDLAALQTSGDDYKFTKVDMKEAQFVNANSGTTDYVWFKTGASGWANIGTRAFVGGQLFRLSVDDREWNSTSDPGQSVPVTQYPTIEAMNEAKYTNNYGALAKIPSYKYCQMQVTGSGTEWRRLGSTDNHTGATEVDWNDESAQTLADHLNAYNVGDIIAVRVYYKKSGSNQESGTWGSTSIVPNSDDFAAANEIFDGEYYGAVEGSLDNTYGHGGDLIYFKHYYRKINSGTREWVSETDKEPEGTVVDGNFNFNDRLNYVNSYANGTWVRMNYGFSYYRLSAKDPATREWVNVSNDFSSMEHVKYHFDTIDSETANNIKNSEVNGTYAIVDGTPWYYSGSVWASGNPSSIPNYSDMKFTYWKETIKEAVTSRYANETVTNELFRECFSLEKVDFLGGNVTGFHDMNSSYHSPLAVNIGKDVTLISPSAFSQCSTLQTLTFDKNYAEFPGATPEAKEAAARDAGYPKKLTIGANAFLQCFNLGSVSIPNRVTTIGNGAFMRAGKDLSGEFKLTFERRFYDDQVYEANYLNVGLSCDYPLTIGDDAFNECSKLKTLSLPVRLKSMGTRAFANTTSLKEIVMREKTNHPVAAEDRLTTIKSQTFTASSVEEITIPASVTLIESAAFQQTNHLKKITFQHDEKITSDPLVIKEGAFAGGGEQDSPDLNVYVNILPTERLIVCEYNAFTFTQMQGQTRTDGSAKIAKLHFPEEAWDYYQGNWKRGLAFKQENLNAFKDGYTDNTKGYMGIGTSDQIKETAGATNSGKAVYSGSGEYTPANGWQQFALTSTGIDIFIPAGSFVRTYSTKKPQVIPTFALLENKPDGVKSSDPMFKIYRISHFNDGYESGSSTAAMATATEINVKVSSRMYIPNNTGVIMVGTSTTATVLLYLSDIEIENPEKYEYTQTQGDEKTNLLWPSCDDDDKTSTITVDGTERVILNPTYPYPYHGSQPELRFFGLGAKTVNSTKTYFFSRFAEGGYITRDKAYLRLSKDIFHWSDEGETASGTGLPEPGSNSAPIMLSFMDSDGNTTDVRMIDSQTMTIMEDCYYTLQGVKLNTRPTQKGIYIHNGKKVVIK